MNETTNYGIDKLEADSISNSKPTYLAELWIDVAKSLLPHGRRGNRVPRKPTLN